MSMNVRLCYQKSLYSQTILVFTNARTFQAFLDAPAEMAIKSEETSVKVRIALFGVANSTSSQGGIRDFKIYDTDVDENITFIQNFEGTRQ